MYLTSAKNSKNNKIIIIKKLGYVELSHANVKPGIVPLLSEVKVIKTGRSDAYKWGKFENC